MYNEEIKMKALNLLKDHTVSEVSQQFSISKSTLYNWKKAAKQDVVDINYYIEISKRIKQLILNKMYDEAIKISKRYSNNEAIQSQLMTVYINQRKYNEAIEIAKRNPNYVPIQSQLMTIYINQRKYNEAIEIAKRYPNNEVIQSQLMMLQSNLKLFQKQIKFNNREKVFPDEICNIRNKIMFNTISFDELKVLDKFQSQIASQDYLLIKLAIYEKMGLNTQCINLLKKSNVLDGSLTNKLISLLSKKNSFYNLEKWDELIGWSSDFENYYKEEKKIKEEVTANKKTSIKEEKTNEKIIKMSTQNLKKEDVLQTNLLSSDNLEVKPTCTTVSSSLSSNKSVNSSKKSSKQYKTVYDTLNKEYKEAILKLKIKYYMEMHVEEKKQSAFYKSDKLEDILASSSNEKSLELLLLMLYLDGNVNIERTYPQEHSKILKRIMSKR